jgi:hypothetical protein
LFVRGIVVLAAVTALVLIGCGGSGGLASDAGPLHDATTADASPDVASVDAGVRNEAGPLEASAEEPDVGPPVPCEAGDDFIVVNYDGGSMVLRSGCGGPLLPTLSLSQCFCPEDCEPTASLICGTSDAGSLHLGINSLIGPTGPVSGVGVYAVGGCLLSPDDSWSLGSSRSPLQGGQVRLKTFPPVGGTVSGDYYVGTLQGGPISGTFCVIRAQ